MSDIENKADDASDTLLGLVRDSLDQDKGEDILVIDLRDKTPMADYMVIVSGRSTRQVSALATKLIDRVKLQCGRSCRVEGLDQGDWALVDIGDVIVHVFRPEVRAFYDLERMWDRTNVLRHQDQA